MRTGLIVGAIILIAGVAGLIVASDHAPQIALVHSACVIGGPCPVHRVGGWPRTTYDAARIASFACLIVGAISALYGLSISVRRPVKA